MTDHQQDPFDELMRRSLADEAARIEPTDALPRLRARVRAERGLVDRRPWLVTAGTAVIGTAAAFGVFAVLTDGNGPDDSPGAAGPATTSSTATTSAGTPMLLPQTPAPSAVRTPKVAPSSPDPATEPTTTPGTPEIRLANRAVPVYWVGKRVGDEGGATPRLYRTFTRVDGQPAKEAVRVMTSRQSDDPDYQSLWTGAKVASVTRSDDLVTVDFEELPRTTLAPAVADLAVQQLVYTVQGALADDTRPVRITERGRVATTVFGVVDTRRPLSRAQAADVQALVWISSPANRAVTSGTVTVTGVAAAYEAQVDWRARNLRTDEVRSGSARTKEGQRFSPYSFPLKLAPGTWEIQVYLESAEDGRATDTDSKTVTVR